MKSAYRILFLCVVATTLPKSIFCTADIEGTHISDPCSNSNSTYSFISHLNDKELSPGTYIVVGINATLGFRDYLKQCPRVEVQRLLLSDATDQDLLTDFGGYRTTNNTRDDYEVENVRHHNTILDINWKHASKGRAEATMQILDRAAPTLVALSYLNYHISPTNNLRGFDRLAEWEPFGGVKHRTRYSDRIALFNRQYPFLKELTVRDSGNQAHHEFCYIRPGELAPLSHVHVIANCGCDTTFGYAGVTKRLGNLTHIRLSGHASQILQELDDPWYFSRYVPPRGFFSNALAFFIAPKVPPAPRRIPENLTVIIQARPPPASALNERNEECNDVLFKYHKWVTSLLSQKDFYTRLPQEEDFQKYKDFSAVFPVNKCIEEFRDRSLGGQGEWAVPEKVEIDGLNFWWLKDGNLPVPCNRTQTCTCNRL